jgi:hypothetical protein
MKEFEELQDTAYNVYNRFRDVAGKKLKNLWNADSSSSCL